MIKIALLGSDHWCNAKFTAEQAELLHPIAGDLELHRRARDLITGRTDGLLQQLLRSSERLIS